MPSKDYVLSSTAGEVFDLTGETECKKRAFGTGLPSDANSMMCVFAAKKNIERNAVFFGVIAIKSVLLLHYCSAEISNNLSWYSANVINDRKPEIANQEDATFSPRPISEIFSTPATFSTENPIVVLPTSTAAPPLGSSTFSSIPPQQGSTLSSLGQSSSLPPFLQDIQQAGFPGGLPQTNPNYFVIYQNAPQGVQSTQPPPPFSSTPGFTSTTSFQTTTGQTFTSQPPAFFSTSVPPSPTPNFSSISSQSPVTSTQNPTNGTRAIPFIKIRMLSPAGSITNIHVNPPSTTKAPSTTRRNRRRNRNNYDGCVNACSGTRTPICAAPLGNSLINPDNLKGFPSICHMACHNSFRKNAYEKVVDGRCGRLRTRIRTVDANKLKRDELNKLQYAVVQDPNTVIEFYPRQK